MLTKYVILLIINLIIETIEIGRGRMSDVCLEQKYNELLDDMIAIKQECEHRINEEKTKCESIIQNIKQRKTKTIISLFIVISIFIIALTYVIGTYFLPTFGNYQYEELTNGKDVVCYVTNTGSCYHKLSCGYLRSVNETTMYQAEMDGYRPCTYCWYYPEAIYRTVTATNYFQKYGTIFVVLTCVSLILFYFIYKKEDEKIKVEIDNENSKLNNYKKLLLEKVFVKLGIENESDFEKEAKSLSGVPWDVEYDDGLPIANDDRYKVYYSCYGKCFHINPRCKGNYLIYESHMFSAMKYLSPCYFCANNSKIPEWHKKYTELINLFKIIENMCEEK